MLEGHIFIFAVGPHRSNMFKPNFYSLCPLVWRFFKSLGLDAPSFISYLFVVFPVHPPIISVAVVFLPFPDGFPMTKLSRLVRDVHWPRYINYRRVCIMFLELTGAFYLGNGWVAGGCWDDDWYCGSFPKILLRLAPVSECLLTIWLFNIAMGNGP